jgi:hypothetical protein
VDLPFAVRKGIPHNHVDLPPLVSIEATWVCIPIDSSEALLEVVLKSPGHAWNDADTIGLDVSHYWQGIRMLNFRFGKG